MNKNIYLILQFNTTYEDAEGNEGTWNYYGKLFPSGTLRVFDPSFKCRDCDGRHYFTVGVQHFITNKGNRYLDIDLIRAAFIQIATRECFYPFREIHYGYDDPYIPEVIVSVRVDAGEYEAPVQIKSNTNDHWIQVTTDKKVLCVDRKGVHKHLVDE